MSKRLFLHAAAATAAAALLPACGGGGGDAGVPIGADTLAQLLQDDSRLSLMREAAAKGGMTATLGDGARNLTLFSAENAAFDALAARLGIAGGGSGLVDRLTGTQWNSILRYALLPQRRSLGSLPNTNLDTLYQYRGDAMQLIFVTDNGQFNVWDGFRLGITVPRSDIAASNGVMHITGELVLPRGVLTVSQMLRANEQWFSVFGVAMSAAVINELNGAGKFTLFMPNASPPVGDNAVRHHVMTGETVSSDFVDGMALTPLFVSRPLTLRTSTSSTTLRYGTAVQATVTDVDFYASNGVIHVINAVIPL
jgi:Fasciclin domain